MPRTNARVWPRANSAESDDLSQREYWLDATPVHREQWTIPGNADPSPHTNYHISTQQHPYPQYQHISHAQVRRIDTHHHQRYITSIPEQQPQWMSLAQYNGHPEQIAQVTTGSSPSKQGWIEHPNQKNGLKNVVKNELWVDGPTSLRKNIEGLTNHIYSEPPTPSKKQHR